MNAALDGMACGTDGVGGRAGREDSDAKKSGGLTCRLNGLLARRVRRSSSSSQMSPSTKRRSANDVALADSAESDTTTGWECRARASAVSCQLLTTPRQKGQRQSSERQALHVECSKPAIHSTHIPLSSCASSEQAHAAGCSAQKRQLGALHQSPGLLFLQTEQQSGGSHVSCAVSI